MIVKPGHISLLILAMLLLVGLAACGGNSGSQAEQATPTALVAGENEGNGPGADGEPNDKREQATQIEPDTEISAALGDSADVDFYAVEIPAGAGVDVTASSSAGSGQMQLTLYDTDGNWMNSDAIGADGLEFKHRLNHEDGGTYFVEVRGGKGKYTFQVSVTPANDAGSEADAPADRNNNSTALEVGSAAEGAIGDRDAEDSYRFTIENGSIFNATLSRGDDEDEGEFTLAIYDKDGNWAGEAQVTLDGEPAVVNHILNSEQGGTYYASVRGEGRYTLLVESTAQNDGGSGADAPDDRNKGVTIETGTDVSGLLGDQDQSDTYRFKVKPSSQLEIAISTTGEGNVSATLYDSAGNWVDEASGVTEGNDGAISRILSADDATAFAIEVRGEGDYTLRVGSGTQNDADSGADAGNERDKATKIELDQEYSGLLGNQDRYDYYRFDVEGGTSLTIQGGFSGSEGLVGFTLYDQNGNWVAETNDLGEGQSESLSRVLDDQQGGTYYLAVDGEGSYTFTVSTQAQSDAGLEGDAPSERGAAFSISADQDLEGRLGNSDSSDYYRVEGLASGGRAAIELSATGEGDGSVAVTVYDQNGNWVADSESVSAGGSTTLEFDVPQGGTLYLDVHGDIDYGFAVRPQ